MPIAQQNKHARDLVNVTNNNHQSCNVNLFVCFFYRCCFCVSNVVTLGAIKNHTNVYKLTDAHYSDLYRSAWSGSVERDLLSKLKTKQKIIMQF